MSIALIDYRAGNLTSVRKALRAVGAQVYMPASPADLARASGVVVPGVGHFEATAALDAAWRTAILDGVRSGTPLLGICLGLQFLFEGSTEAPATPGLGLFPGLCRRLGPVWAQGGSADAWTGIKIPHVGWSGVRAQGDSVLLAGLRADAQAYFTHSYAAPLGEETIGVTTCGPAVFASAVERDHVFGVQFHPEKSSGAGLRLLRNFAGICAGGTSRLNNAGARLRPSGSASQPA
jgi:glutamine amidotransferase